MSRELAGEPWMSVAEAARYIGVRADTIYKWIARRGFPANKAGRLWRFRRDHVDHWVIANRSESSSILPTEITRENISGDAK
jgi:excisionase family DNA binding protein